MTHPTHSTPFFCSVVCRAGLAQSYVVSGSSNQPSINGVYALCKSCSIFGHAYYTKGTGSSKRCLYWTPKYKSKWLIADVGQR